MIKLVNNVLKKLWLASIFCAIIIVAYDARAQVQPNTVPDACSQGALLFFEVLEQNGGMPSIDTTMQATLGVRLNPTSNISQIDGAELDSSLRIDERSVTYQARVWPDAATNKYMYEGQICNVTSDICAYAANGTRYSDLVRVAPSVVAHCGFTDPNAPSQP